MDGITRESPSASGSWCVFVKLNDTHGVKFYTTSSMRDEALALQRAAWEVMCGPAVGDVCEMPWMPSWRVPYAWNDIGTPSKVFGYITELVDTEGLSHHEYKALLKKLRDNGISTHDLASCANVGHTKDGNAVRFDFDPMYYR